MKSFTLGLRERTGEVLSNMFRGESSPSSTGSTIYEEPD
jgi:hypothetical protein